MKPTIRRGTFGRWTVHEPDGTQTQFRTHAQAVAHADEIARTVTITLPPFNGFTSVGPFELSVLTHGTLIQRPFIPEHIFIKPEDETPLALALLAGAHYRERRNQ